MNFGVVVVLAFAAVIVFDLTKRGSQGPSELGSANGAITHVFGDITGG